MQQWQFNPDQYDPNASYELPPVGKHRVRIEEAEEQTSKNSGNEMIKLTLSVSGCGGRLFHYIVFMPDNPQFTNQKLGELFDSFGIKPGDMNILNWRGKVGAANVKHEMHEGKTNAKVSFFILRSKQSDLPPWIEKGNATSLRDDPAFGSGDGEADTPF